MSEDVGPKAFPETHYAAVGRVAAAWALFEAFLDAYIAQAACVHEKTAACMTAQIAGHGRKMNALIALMRLNNASDKLIKDANKLAENATSIAERRNRIVHDPWTARPGDRTPPDTIISRMEVTAQRRLRFEFRQVSTAEVLSTDQAIGELTERLTDLVKRFEVERHT